jgi:hypothetical protein
MGFHALAGEFCDAVVQDGRAWSLRKVTMDELRASSSCVSHTRDMRWQSQGSSPFHTLLKSCKGWQPSA